MNAHICLQITCMSFLYSVAHELEQLFIKQSSLEVYFEWLDSVIEKRVSEVCLEYITPILHTSLVKYPHNYMQVQGCKRVTVQVQDYP